MMRYLAHLLCCLSIPTALAADESTGTEFYKDPQGLFSTRPGTSSSSTLIRRFGPVGMGIELVQPAFTMRIHNIEEGSPAAATGALEKGQYIQSINGQKLEDIDPRIQLGNILAEAEATDGRLKMMIADIPDGGAGEVVVEIPVLGAYSETWPLNCPKSDKIVRNFAEYLASPGAHKGFSGIGMLFLLGTGEDEDLAVVREWAREQAKRTPGYAWHLGYGGIPLCEYYLRTGDAEVLPGIQNWVDSAIRGQVHDGWAGRGGIAHATYGGGGGHLNAGGTGVVTFLLLAKECGVDVPEEALARTLRHFFRYSGRGVNPYGDGRPEDSFVDNGKNGKLAFAMAAAAALDPRGEDSIYAAARDHLAMNGFYTTGHMLHGHTGGGIGEIWRSASVSLLYESRPKQFRSFLDERRWHYDLSRRWDGSFAILGGARYDSVEWGGGYPLAYVIPRGHLRVAGAPPTAFSHPYELPERPWGTAADDVFLSIDGARDSNGVPYDTTHETVAEHTGKVVIDRLNGMRPIPDEVLQELIRHPDFLMRHLAADNAAGIVPNYMWRQSGDPVRAELLHEWARAEDPRTRAAALSGLLRIDAGKALTDDLFQRLIDGLADPEESWWIKDLSLQLIGRASADNLVPHVDFLLSFLKHDEWWIQNAALQALAPIVADERCYEKVIPAIGEMVRTNQRWNTTAPLRRGPLISNLRNAGPEVAELATEVLRETFTGYEGVTTTPAGLGITGNFNAHVDFIAATLANVPGGYDVLYHAARERQPDVTLPYSGIFLGADPERLGPELREKLKPLILERLVYETIGRNYRRYAPDIEGTRQGQFPNSSLDGLANLYQRGGVDDYLWRPFGPDLREEAWSFHTFDPPEERPYDASPWRFREVSLPRGMEDWHQPGFNPAEAGWQQGKFPIGQFDGELVEPMRSFWEKEVLLVRGTFDLPKLKSDHLYRIRLGTGDGVGDGDGYRIWINGELLIEVREGRGRRQGGEARGAFITREFRDMFGDGPVTIAATTFRRYGNRAIVTSPPVPQGIFSLWLEEMKIPPVNIESLRKSAAVIPMLTSEWQAMQSEDAEQEEGEDDGRFRYSGEFEPNPELAGDWSLVAVVPDLGEFSPDGSHNTRGAPFTSLTLKDDGLTDDDYRIWSGDMLMDIENFQAMRTHLHTEDGVRYLVVEAGGFSNRNRPDWTTNLLVMKQE